MTHKQKLKLARKLMSNRELVQKVAPFASKRWEQRKQAIAARTQRLGVS